MSQYDVATQIVDAEAGLTESELVNRIDLSKSAVEASINDLLQKDYIEKKNERYIWNSEIDLEKIENIRPRSLSELDF